MVSRIILGLLFCIVPVTSIPMIVYNNAWFNPTNVSVVIMNLSLVTTMNACACQCYSNSLCLTGMFFGINQTCILFSAYLWQGQLQPTTDTSARLFSFPNTTINTDSINPPTIIEWLFDGNLNDVYGRYNGDWINQSQNSINNSNTLWKSIGYAGYGSAVYFSPTMYSFVDHYLNLITTSFTISAWIWMPFNFSSSSTPDYFALFTHCQNKATDKCLHTVIGNGNLRLGFYGDDLIGNTKLKPNQWYHVTYVYDRSATTQLVYLNGNLDGSRISSSYTGNTSQIILGATPLFTGVTYHSGFIDKLTFVSRVKNASELIDEATLVAYYRFDNSYLDSGPNKINNIINISTIFDSAGRFNQALMINSTNSSYFQTTGFYYLGQTNYSYSFTLWIYPFVNNGTILQISSTNGWCVPMIGFNSSGYLTIQTLGSNGIYTTSWMSGMSPVNQWIHVSMTYSTTNGIRLFINGLLTSSNNTSTDYVASGNMNTIIIGTCLQPDTCAVNQTKIVPSQFQGKIDELKIFSRELSTSEVYQLV